MDIMSLASFPWPIPLSIRVRRVGGEGVVMVECSGISNETDNFSNNIFRCSVLGGSEL
jgi:hypothetical protein